MNMIETVEHADRRTRSQCVETIEASRTRLDQKLLAAKEYEERAARMPEGSIQRESLLRLAQLERDAVREQRPSIERAATHLNRAMGLAGHA